MKFWDCVEIKEDLDSCWEWKSKAGTNEYGNTTYRNSYWSSHRLAWFLYYGEIPQGMYVCHKCDNPPCCNPNHLFLGTHQDNVNDREKKRRNKLPRCSGEKHGQHKLTNIQVNEIRTMYATGRHSYRSLSGKYGVSFGEIRKIVKREVWIA